MQNGMSQSTVYFNGTFVPEAEARVSIFDSALMYGDMAFLEVFASSIYSTPVRSSDGSQHLWSRTGIP